MWKRLFMILISSLLLLPLAACGVKDPVISGTIEADELPIVAEVGGSAQTIPVEEGATLKKNQLIAQLDPKSYQISVNEAEAALAQATAKLEEAKAGTRNQEIQAGIATVQQASANISLSEARVKQGEANLKKSKDQLSQVEQQLEGAKRTLAFQERRMHEIAQLYKSEAVSKRDYDTQQEAVNQAQTQVNQLAAQVAANRSQYEATQEDVAAAQANVGTSNAQWENANAKLDLLQAGNTDYMIRQLIAAERQTRAKLDQARLQLEKATITAPEDGTLLRKNITEGEVAKAGATLFTMMKKDKLKLKVYIPEADLGNVSVGKKVGIQVDAYPGKTFTGVIRTISDDAEYTPKNVQTKDERTKLVFAVTIDIKTGVDKLKPGMPADVLLDLGGDES